jgi:hypothetical protein
MLRYIVTLFYTCIGNTKESGDLVDRANFSNSFP